MKQEREVRYSDLLMRSISQVTEENAGIDTDRYYVVHGSPIVLNDRTQLAKDQNGDPIYEVIERSALENCDLSDVVFNINHGDGNFAVARTRNGTILFNRTENSLDCTILLDKSNPRCVQAYKDIESGLLDKMSFAFTIADESYDYSERCYHVNSIDKVYDISAVEFPAYNNTSISARRLSEAVAEREKAVADRLQNDIEELLSKIDEALKR